MPASFTVSASGSAPLSYQWRKGGQDITGATGSTFSIASALAGDAAAYSVRVTNACGSDTSAEALLTINRPAAVATDPVAIDVCSGQPAAFTVTAGGSAPISYQWRKDGQDISDATGSTFSIASALAGDAAAYSVRVTNACGSNTSADALLTIKNCDQGFQIAFDANQDNRVDLADVIDLLGLLFLGTWPRLPCGDGTINDPSNIHLYDWSDDRGIDISDAIAALNWMFLGGRAHPTFVGDQPACVQVSGCPNGACR